MYNAKKKQLVLHLKKCTKQHIKRVIFLTDIRKSCYKMI